MYCISCVLPFAEVIVDVMIVLLSVWEADGACDEDTATPAAINGKKNGH